MSYGIEADSRPERRWNDGAEQKSNVTNVFCELETLKPEYRQLVGHVMLRIAEAAKKRRWTEDQRMRQGLKELGADKVVGLMKSQQRRRWYDQDKTLHKVYQHLYILEQSGNPYLSRAMGRAIFYLKEYLVICEKHERLNDTKEMVYLMNLALFKGVKPVEDYLDQLDRDANNPLPESGAKTMGRPGATTPDEEESQSTDEMMSSEKVS